MTANSKNTKSELDVLYAKVMSKVHPDKVADDFKDEANELAKRANAAKDKGDTLALRQLLAELLAGKHFKPTLAMITVEVEKLKADGHDKAYAKAFGTVQGWDKKLTAEAVQSVYGSARSGSTDKSVAVGILIRASKNGRTRKEMINELCAELGWKEASAATLVSYLAYMVEYANQINR